MFSLFICFELVSSIIMIVFFTLPRAIRDQGLGKSSKMRKKTINEHKNSNVEGVFFALACSEHPLSLNFLMLKLISLVIPVFLNPFTVFLMNPKSRKKYINKIQRISEEKIETKYTDNKIRSRNEVNLSL